MARVGFLGLGEMGTPMARRLLRAGHDLVVWNRSPERTVGLAQEGAAVAPSPAQAVVGADFIITMVATPEALEQVLFGTAGLAASLLPGQVVIDMSTVGPDEIRSVSARLPKSAVLVDAPVRGSVPQATSGRLDIFVGATDEHYERVRPILDSLGSVRHAGGPGSGGAMKLVAKRWARRLWPWEKPFRSGSLSGSSAICCSTPSPTRPSDRWWGPREPTSSLVSSPPPSNCGMPRKTCGSSWKPLPPGAAI